MTDFRRPVTVSTIIEPTSDLAETLAGEADWWATFGTVTDQYHDWARNAVLTTVKVGPAGRRALEGSLRARLHSRLVTDPATAIGRSTHV